MILNPFLLSNFGLQISTNILYASYKVHITTDRTLNLLANSKISNPNKYQINISILQVTKPNGKPHSFKISMAVILKLQISNTAPGFKALNSRLQILPSSREVLSIEQLMVLEEENEEVAVVGSLKGSNFSWN